MIKGTDFIEKSFGINKKVINLCSRADENCRAAYEYIDEIAAKNQFRVLAAFQAEAVRETHLHGTTGYGYDDSGRDVIDNVFARVFSCEDALVRHNIISGTHAISLCFFGVLRPGDTILSLTGKPYDTLHKVINGKNQGSLLDFKINYKEAKLKKGKPDIDAINELLQDKTVKAALIQRSKGYDFRPSLSVAEVEKLIKIVKSVNKNVVVIVDNCYGEFTDIREPKGADLMAGSLIKNPGGGIAKGGGYIAGREKYVQLCSYKLNSVGIGKHAGATYETNRDILQGFFMAPKIVKEALKAAVFASSVFELLGFEVSPLAKEKRSDIIQAIKFNNKDALIAFCKGIQKGAPIDSFVEPVPWAMPGYSSEVIMAAGAFVQGATTELSADAPIRAPYIAYMQGSLAAECGQIGVMKALEELLKLGIIKV